MAKCEKRPFFTKFIAKVGSTDYFRCVHLRIEIQNIRIFANSRSHQEFLVANFENEFLDAPNDFEGCYLMNVNKVNDFHKHKIIFKYA